MFIPSNLIIQDLLMFHATKNIISEGIEEKYKEPLEYLVSLLVTTTLNNLGSHKDFSEGVEPINDTIKQKIEKAGYNLPEATSPDRFLIQFILELADKNSNPTLYAPILMRLLSAYETISNSIQPTH
jgi:hypothetical protein